MDLHVCVLSLYLCPELELLCWSKDWVLQNVNHMTVCLVWLDALRSEQMCSVKERYGLSGEGCRPIQS